MTVRLVIQLRNGSADSSPPEERLFDQEEIVLGRERSCDVVLSQAAVSRRHAKIVRDGTLYFVEDLGSAYGTRVNGEKLAKTHKRLLRNGDVIAVAPFDVAFQQRGRADDEASQAGTGFLAKEMVRGALRSLSGTGEAPFFRVMNGELEGERFPIEEAQELIVGRGVDAAIRLQTDLVSRQHAKLRRDWSGVHVEDLGSRNGIKVNRERVRRVKLKSHDELEIGGIRLLFLDPSELAESVPRQPPLGEPTDHARDAEPPDAADDEGDAQAPAEQAEDGLSESPETPEDEAPESEGEALEEAAAPPEELPADPSIEGEASVSGRASGMRFGLESLKNPKIAVALGLVAVMLILLVTLVIALAAGM